MIAVTATNARVTARRPVAVSSPPPARRAPVPPGTYRRRRATVVGVVVAVAIVAITLLGRLGGGPLASSEPTLVTVPVAATTYVVQPGDTLWSIARRIQPTGDVRWLVDELVAQRGGRTLQAGERITLP